MKSESKSPHHSGEMIFFISFAQKNEQFYRICFVITGLKYANTSAPLMPRIFGMLIARFRFNRTRNYLKILYKKGNYAYYTS